MTGEPWVWEPPEPDPRCSNCGSDSWDDDKAACTACGDTIFDVAERIAAHTKARAEHGPTATCWWFDEAATLDADALSRAQAIRDHQTQGGPE